MIKTKTILRYFSQIGLVLSLLVSHGLVFASNHEDVHKDNKKELDHDHSQCGKLLADKNYKIIFSGRDESVQDEIRKYVELLYGEGGVLKKLGYTTPDHIIQFLENRDLKAISANNRLPIGHWTDGANVVQADNRPSGILEMVIFGQKTTHSIYRDDLNLKQQISIINHVVGHNHFGSHTRWASKGDAPNQSAYEFDHYLEELKLTHDRQEISEWLQYLNSMTWAQDIKNADIELPQDFSAVTVEKKVKDGGPIRSIAQHPNHPTANILQAFVANLPRGIPEWKKEVAIRFEKSVRYIPGAVRTKIMNEGFAVLTQELLPPHTPYTAEDDVFEYCCLMPGVIRPSLENPYWLGIQAWRNIRGAFNSRPGMRELSLLERDKAFLKYATEEILERMDDSEFLRLGLDDHWIAKYRLALTRPANYQKDGYDNSVPRSPDPKKNHQYIVVTRKPERVREAIIAKVKGFLSFGIPGVRLSSLGLDGSGTVRLELSDDIGRKFPLDRKKLSQTLLVMAQIMRQPVSLESTMEIVSWTAPDWLFQMDHFKNMPPEQLKYYLELYAEPKFTGKRVRVTVAPDGDVKAEEVLRNGSSDPQRLEVTEFIVAKEKGVTEKLEVLPELGSELQGYVDLFKQDLALGQTELSDLLPKNSILLPSQLGAQIEASIRAAVEGVSPRLKLAVPTVGHATEAYYTEIRSRALKALHLALLGQRGIQHKLNGVRVRALPDIPSFEYDQKAMQRLIGELPLPSPALERNKALSLRNAEMTPASLSKFIDPTADFLSGDMPADVNPVEGEPGRRFWGPDPRDGGGDGEGDQPSDGRKPGEGGNDPAFVDIDLNTYAEALGAVIELPNLRPKNGQTETTEDVRGDWTHRRDGPPHAPIIVEKAFARGIADLRMKGDKRDLRNLSAMERMKLLRTGMAKLDMVNEWAVEHFEERPSPEINAQVTLMMDLSGSYSAFVDKTKQMFYDLRALLLMKYKKVEFRFVAFDGTAYAFQDPEEFFRLQLGGGTSYAVGLKSVLKVQEEFPEGQWDRYTVIAGDMEDGTAPDLEKVLDEVRQNSQFLASVKMSSWQGAGMAKIEELLRQWHQSDPYVSFVDLSPQNNYEPLILRRVFKNEEKSN